MSTIQYVTVAQALASTQSNLNVEDTAANIAGAPASLWTGGRVSTVSLGASATIAASMLAKLAALPATLALKTNGFALTVSDAAYNLLTLTHAEIGLLTHTTLTGSPTLTAAQVIQLRALPGFTMAAGDHVVLSDTLADIAAVIGTHMLAFTTASAVTVRLDGTHVGAVTAAELGQVAASGVAVTFAPSGAHTTLPVTAAAHDIAANAAGLRDLAGHVTLTYTLTNPGAAVSASDGAALAGLTGFNPATQLLSVTDTGANIAAHGAALFGHGFTTITVSSGNFAGNSAQLLDATLHLAAGATASLGTSATIGETSANTLAALGGFALASGVTLTVQDSAANLLSLSGAAQAVATSLRLSAPQTVTVQQLAGLAALGGKFTEAGNAVTVQGSVAALEALAPPALALATQITVQDTAANIVAGSAALGTAHTTYTLSASGTVTGAQAASLAALGTALGLNGQALTVQDNAAGVTANSAALFALGATASVTDTVAGLTAHEAALVALGAALNSVTISDPAAATAAAVAALAPLAAKMSAASALTVQDSAADISANLTALEQVAATLGTHLVLEVTGTAAQLGGYAASLAQIGAGLQVTLTDQSAVAAGVAAALAPLAGHFVSGTALAVSDSVVNVVAGAAGLDAIAAALGTVTMTGLTVPQTAAAAALLAPLASHLAAGEQISVNDTAADLGANSAALLALSQDGKLAGVADLSDTVAGATANSALLNSLNANVALQDTAAHVAAGIDALSQIHGLAHITLTDAGTPTLALSVAQVTGDATVLGTITGSYTVTVTDTAAAIEADLTGANSVILGTLLANNRLAGIASTTGPLTLTYAQVTGANVDTAIGGALQHFSGALNVTGVTYAHVAGLSGLSKAPSTISVADTAANINTNLTAILANAQVVGLTVTDGGVLSVAVNQVATVSALLTQSASLSVSDTAAHIAADLAAGHSVLISELTANPAALTAIHLTGANSLTLTAAATQALVAAHELTALAALIQSGGAALVLNVSMANLASVSAYASSHVSVVVDDTAANIATDLLSGNSVLEHNSTAVSNVVLTADPATPPPALSAAAISALYTYGVSNPNSVALPVADSAANILALDGTTPGAAALALATSITVSDSAADISAQLHALTTANLPNLHVTLTDAAPVLTVSWNTYSSSTAVLDTITNVDTVTNRGPVVVSDLAAALAGNAAALLNDTHVGKVQVADSAADVEAGANLAELQALGSLLWITLTDSTLSAAAVTAGLLQSAHVTTTGGGVADTAQAIADLVIAVPAAAAFLNSVGATATSVAAGGLSVAEAAALEGLTNFHATGQTLVVYDTVAHLTGAGAAAVLANSLVSGVYLNATGHAATPTAAQAVALFALPHFHNTDLAGTANTITVQDSAAAIDAVHTQLAALGSDLAGIQVNASATVSDAVLGDLQALGATAINDAVLTVSDTAANIANNATAQTTGSPSITATYWQLATSASVSEAQAVVLGNLGASLNTDPSGHQLALIVTLAGNTAASVADANALANLNAALALNLNGHTLAVTDTAAHLATLSGNALQFIVPNATVVVSDTAPISETTADNLLRLLKNNNLPANETGTITSAQLSFAQPESVTGVISDLRGLNTDLQTLTGTAGTGWTGSATLANAFQLTAADTVANLIFGGNTTFLSGLHATTLSADASADATDAETLATLASEIHFSLGTSTLTVTDSAVNLLNPLNHAGVALASTVQLSSGGPALDAADALSLLSLHNLVLTAGNPLVVQDSAANLLGSPLDAALTAAPYGAHITVELSGDTPVTVQQAATLEALPGFTGTVVIADSSANLLSAANAAVVNGASTTVQLAGSETASAATILALTQLVNFNAGNPGGVLTLAANDTANQASLLAIAALGSNFSAGGHTLTLTANVTVTAAQFEALQNDGVVLNGHVIAVSDTVGNLESLLTNAAWANSVALHGSYQLVATDTVAGLTTLETGHANAGLAAQLYAVGLSQNDSTTTINASALATVVAGTAHAAFSANGQSLTVIASSASDVTSNLTMGGQALATSIEVPAADAITLMDGQIVLAAGQTLTVSDTAGNLETNAATLLSAITAGGYTDSQVMVQLTAGQGTVSVNNTALGELLSLPNFSVNGNTLALSGAATVSGDQAKLIADFGANFSAGVYTVTLTTDATGLTAAELQTLYADHLVANGHAVAVTDTAAALLGLTGGEATLATQLSLSAAASVTAAQLASLADFGAKFSDGGNAITLTADALALTPTEYAALQADGVLANQVANGHVISAALGGITASDANSVLSLAATGVAGATVKIYDEHGALLTSAREGHSGFTITTADPGDQAGHGQAFAFTEVVNGVESAPVVVLDQGTLQAAVAAANTTFANNVGDVSVVAGETLHLYTAGDAALQSLANPALVYDPSAHTVSLDIPGSAPVVLITLGASTDPATAASIDVVVKHHQ